jgi:hypothetical protein
MSIARSGPECRLFIELHPCTCGEHQLQPESRVESTSAGLLAVYEGECPRCGVPRRFEFLLDPEIPPGDKFGGTRPSTLIDAPVPCGSRPCGQASTARPVVPDGGCRASGAMVARSSGERA